MTQEGWLFLAARALGMNAEAAASCVRDRVFSLGACRIALVQAEDDAPGRWCATSVVPKPASIRRDIWLEALLKANAVLMAHGGIAFGLDSQERTMLMMRTSCTGDSAAMAGELQLFAAAWSAASVRTARRGGRRLALPLFDDGAVFRAYSMQASTRVLDAAARRLDVSRILHECLEGLGASTEQATSAVTRGQFRVDEIDVCVETLPDASSLLVSTMLPPDAAQRTSARAALLATASLMPRLGAALGRDAFGLRLQACWSAHHGHELPQHLVSFAALSSSLDAFAARRAH